MFISVPKYYERPFFSDVFCQFKADLEFKTKFGNQVRVSQIHFTFMEVYGKIIWLLVQLYLYVMPNAR